MTRVQTIREQIAARLRGEVLTGRFVEGEPLREQSLAERFGVSRGPIRDVLLQLSQEGLLVARPNCGVTVGKLPSPEDRPLMVRLRRDIEVFALDRIFDQLDDDDVTQWEQMAVLFKQACKRGDMAHVVELDMAFHRSIVARAEDGNLVPVWLPIVTRMMLRYSRHHDLSESHAEHAAIVDAIRRRRKADAKRLLKQHIQ